MWGKGALCFATVCVGCLQVEVVKEEENNEEKDDKDKAEVRGYTMARVAASPTHPPGKTINYENQVSSDFDVVPLGSSKSDDFRRD